MQVRKIDTKRLYALKYIRKANSISRLCLFSPFVHLFAYLQGEQRFDINRSRFYIAELLCVLETSGHITIRGFGLYKLEKDEDCTTTFHGTLEYPAPELLLGQGYTEAVDLWTLGAFPYEMLTGLTTFYDKDTHEIHRKILSKPLYFPGLDMFPCPLRICG
ncbi:hypothetical protein M430DRAFT_53812 [Amorphotheca resinae ATCC 22711]|uniref:Protein kinase domain-containing protein n=1 Tax=Amorphotheca resinae ATCC 22711 TaxID=857342 RepID=A0A2T3ASG1_AMORE|nr:hypothetical protein M430DRAFT_53812 [Amorphotheca resinae ATCC 22711]PSS09288.1 hypothetical protein M430DRAFT_53812 [Amorphotheca resinae ATCC 22711]